MKRPCTTSLALLLLASSALSAQQTTTRRNATRARPPVVVHGPHLHSLALLPALAAIEPALASIEPALASIEPALASAQAALMALPPDLMDIPILQQQEAAEVAYRQAREELNDNNYRRAAEMFANLIARYPRSTYVGDAHFWQAFALSRLRGTDNLEKAMDLLDVQKRSFPRASTRGEADELYVRIQSELARTGDSRAAESVTRTANRGLDQECPRREDEGIRTAALNGIMQMDPENALPVLRQIMAKKDACSASLRRRAVMILAQQRTSEDILLEAARNDPDAEVRSQAVFWLGQVNSDKALSAIESILNGSNDPRLQERAIFALSQHNSPRASQIMRAWAESNDRPTQLRDRAIFWLGQNRDPANTAYLRNLFGKLTNNTLKERVLFALSQRSGEGNEKWLLDVAREENEDTRMRTRALFWAGQMNSVAVQDLISLYDRVSSREMKEQLIFVYSQRREREAVDKMMDIVRKEQDRRLKERAIFWLGQSKDPRVPQFLLDIIG